MPAGARSQAGERMSSMAADFSADLMGDGLPWPLARSRRGARWRQPHGAAVDDAAGADVAL